jgi:hypothetical protein
MRKFVQIQFGVTLYPLKLTLPKILEIYCQWNRLNLLGQGTTYSRIEDKAQVNYRFWLEEAKCITVFWIRPP